MTEIISTPKISEILLEEFMNPLQISAYRLAMDIHVPASRILEILHDKRKITADTSIRLGRYFGVSDSYFLNLQSDIDIRNEKLKREDEWGHQKLITIIKRPVPKPNEVNRRFKGKLYLIMRTFLTILVSVLLLLISVSAWAMRPEEGIYEKKDADGRITARMFVIVMSGYATKLDVLGRLNMTDTGYIIALQALDGEGNVTEELASNYSQKTPVVGAGESGIRLTGENIRNAQDFNKEFTPEVFSTSFGQQVEFDFREPGKAGAHHCSDALDGEYVLNPDATGDYPVSAVVFAYEHAYNFNSFLKSKDMAPDTYKLLEEHRKPYCGNYYNLEIKWKDRMNVGNVTAEKNMRIVMLNRENNYYFLFVKKNYHGHPSWVKETWREFTGTDDVMVNAMYLHRHMTLFAPEIVKDPYVYLRRMGSATRKGPDGKIVTTHTFWVMSFNGKLMRLGRALVSDDGALRFYKEMGRGAIKGEAVRVRQTPDTNGKILGEFNTGYPLTVLGFVEQTGDHSYNFAWAKVQLDNGATGYVYGKYISGVDTPLN